MLVSLRVFEENTVQQIMGFKLVKKCLRVVPRGCWFGEG
jgi:hypothetical protein